MLTSGASWDWDARYKRESGADGRQQSSARTMAVSDIAAISLGLSRLNMLPIMAWGQPYT
jgi:hypothetical protein